MLSSVVHTLFYFGNKFSLFDCLIQQNTYSLFMYLFVSSLLDSGLPTTQSQAFEVLTHPTFAPNSAKPPYLTKWNVLATARAGQGSHH